MGRSIIANLISPLFSFLIMVLLVLYVEFYFPGKFTDDEWRPGFQSRFEMVDRQMENNVFGSIGYHLRCFWGGCKTFSYPDKTSTEVIAASARQIWTSWVLSPIFLVMGVFFFTSIYLLSPVGRLMWSFLRFLGYLPSLLIVPFLFYYLVPNLQTLNTVERTLLFIILVNFRWIFFLTDVFSHNLHGLWSSQQGIFFRSLGIHPVRLYIKWLAPQALLPLTTKLPQLFLQWLSGSLLAEMFLSMKGVGYLLVWALGQRDWPLLNHIIFLFFLILVLAQLVSLWLAAMLDPRTKEAVHQKV